MRLMPPQDQFKSNAALTLAAKPFAIGGTVLARCSLPKEGAMAWFRKIKTLQTIASAHASIHNHFNHDRKLNKREIFKRYRSAALAEWRQLAA